MLPILSAVLSLALCIAAGRVAAETYRYGSLVALAGELISATADAAITYDEKPHQFPALQLTRPVSVVCTPRDVDCEPEVNVMLLHLVLREQQMTVFKRLKGRPAKLQGTLFHSDNGHHFTPVLLDVESIVP